MRFACSDPARAGLPALAVALVVLGGCAPEPQVAVEAGTEARPAFAIPHPSLDGMEPEVASALEEQRVKVDALFGRDDVTEGERAQELGELGRLYQAHRLVEAAEACYRQAHDLAPDSFEWAYLLGVLAARRGNLEEAVAAFEDAVELRPRDLPAAIRLADLEVDRGNLDRAQPLYATARSLDPTMAAAEYGLGRVAAEQREYRQAVEHFDRALALQPRASVIHYHLGQAYRQLGNLEEAETQLARSGPVKVAIPDPLMAAVNSLVASASPFLIQGNMALRDGRLTVAANAFRRAIEADPENPLARQSLATVLTILRDSAGAMEQLEAAAALAPDNAQAQSNLGAALAKQGSDERALDRFLRAVELEPELQEARFNLANTLARLGRLDEAEIHYRHLLEIDPSHLAARSRLGTVLAQAGKLGQAILELRRVVEQDPEDAQAHLNLARVHFNLATSFLRQNDRLRALDHFQSALHHDDQLAQAHFNVASLLAGAGRLLEALPHFERLRELQPDHRRAPLSEATALMLLERFSEAKAALEDAVRRMPDESSTAHALARLLAASPDPSLRNGARSLALINGVLEGSNLPSHVETQAMALAEVGRFEEAAGRQRAVLAEIERRGRSGAAERLARNLERYEEGRSCCADSKDVLPSN